MGTLFNVKLKATEDSLEAFMGEPLFRKGDVIYGIMDSHTEMIYAKCKWGNQFLRMKGFCIDVLDEYKEGSSLDGLSDYIKLISVQRWMDENKILDTYELVYITLNSANLYENKVKGNGGFEYLFHDRDYFALMRKDKPNEYITQIRKGSIFYLMHDSVNFSIRSVDNQELTYQLMKEIRFLVENNYKTGGNN